MTTQPENKDKTEPKISKDELSDKDLAKVTGGGKNATKSTTVSESFTLNFTEVKFTYTQ